jgi:energy-coupling factor transport system ATP-binding protein
MSDGQLVKIGRPDEIYSQIDLLYQHFLRPPQVAETFYLMAKRGVRVPRVPVKMEQGIPDLIQASSTCQVTQPEALPTPPPATGEPLLSVQNLKHVYPDGTQALHGISLDIRQGEYVLIIGQNGAGKSTLVKHFLNLLQPTQGSVKVNGVETRELSVSGLARRIGYVAQNPDNQIFSASVGDEVAFALRNLKYPKDQVEAQTVESLTAMGLLKVRDMHPLALPKGDRARIVIAAILAMRPEIIIFDEPTTGQDFRGARYILDVSRNLHQMGKTVIVITHHLYLMPEYAERVIVMGKGTLLLDAPIREAYHQTELLRSTYLTPPQAVQLAQCLSQSDGREFKLLTPKEVAACFGCDETPGGAA